MHNQNGRFVVVDVALDGIVVLLLKGNINGLLSSLPAYGLTDICKRSMRSRIRVPDKDPQQLSKNCKNTFKEENSKSQSFTLKTHP